MEPGEYIKLIREAKIFYEYCMCIPTIIHGEDYLQASFKGLTRRATAFTIGYFEYWPRTKAASTTRLQVPSGA